MKNRKTGWIYYSSHKEKEKKKNKEPLRETVDEKNGAISDPVFASRAGHESSQRVIVVELDE